MNVIDIHITVDETGKVGVTGPVDNLAQLLGVFEMAKAVVLANATRQQPAQIVRAGMPIPGLRG
jgi:hypothetical protein